MDLTKEACTAIPGRMCLYAGDGEAGLEVGLPAGERLVVSPVQIARIFAAARTFNRLLQPCRGFDLGWPPSGSATTNHWETGRRDVRRKHGNHARVAGSRTPRDEHYRHLVPPRFREWLDQHASGEFGRLLSDEEALYLQAAFCGDGLLPMDSGAPGDFPVADPLTSLQAIVGKRSVYEENRRLVAVEIQALQTAGDEPSEVLLALRNLALPGFEPDFPAEFVVSSAIETLSIDDGRVSTYMGIWMLVTHAGTVDRLIDIAAALPGRRELLKACRRLAFGYTS